MLADAAAGEAERFDAAHRGDDTGLYERAIGPRRTARRAAEAGAGMLAIVAVLVGGAAIAGGLEGWRHEAPATSEAPSEAPSVARTPSASWWLEQDAWDPQISAAHATALWDLGDAEACSRLPGVPLADGASDPSAIGGFDMGGAAVGLQSRLFETEEAAREYVAEVSANVSACADQVDGGDFVATASDVTVQNVPGAGHRLDIAPADARSSPWRLWVQARGADVLVAIGEPGAADRVSAVVTDWFTGGAHP